MNTHALTRFASLLLVICVLAAGGSVSTALEPAGAKARQTVVRAVRLGSASLNPNIISATGTAFGDTPATATITVTVATSVDVLNGTIARVELTEDSNTAGVVYHVTGGNAGGGGRVSDVTLSGGGQSETIRYTIKGDVTSPPGSVHFRVNLRSVRQPAEAPLPTPVTENPTTISEGLMLTFQRGTAGGGEDCGDEALVLAGLEAGGEGPCYASPILVDVAGDGFSLTGLQDGVDFDFNGDGYAHKVSWTAPGTDDAWLALDRNADGRITLGAELFGDYTPQPASDRPNGFLALAEFDKPLDGGNGDGAIDESDEVFRRLRLWQDRNGDGVSQPDELHTLYGLGLRKIELNYRESRRTDDHGNRFRYRAKVWRHGDANVARWAWDVFLLAER